MNNHKNLKKATVLRNIDYYTLSEDDEKYIQKYFNHELIELSRHIDISILQGITFSNTEYYEEAINIIDRGFPLKKRIIPSENAIAMTLPIKKGNDIKCHIVFNISAWTFESDYATLTLNTLYIIAHEMAHVEIMENLHKYKKDICFPKYIFSIRELKSFYFSKLAIEEFIACKISNIVDCGDTYFISFEKDVLNVLREIETTQKSFIEEYSDDSKYIEQICNLYGNLFILCSYYLGSKKEDIDYHIDIKNSFLFEYIDEMSVCLNKIFNEYPKFQDFHFDDIKGIFEKMIFNTLFNNSLRSEWNDYI